MANANLALVTTSNTFFDWLNLTDNEANSVNELRNGNYYKDNGNFTVANGSILIITPSGTTLSVTANALVSGYLTAGNLSITQNLSVTGGSNLANVNISGTMNATYESITNTSNPPLLNVATLYASAISNTNIASWQFLSAPNSSCQLVLGANGQIVNSNANASGNTFRIHNHWDGNVYFNLGSTFGDMQFFTNNAVLALRVDAGQNTNVSGNLLVTQNATITQNLSTGNIAVTQNSTSGNLTVSQNTATGNLSVTQNASTGNLKVTSVTNTATLNVTTGLVDIGTAQFGGALPANIAAFPGITIGSALNGNNFFLEMNVANSGANNGLWESYVANSNNNTVNTGSLTYRTASDNYTKFNNWLVVNRANVNISSIILGNLIDTPAITLQGSVNIAGVLNVSSISTANAAVYANGTIVVQAANVNFNNTVTVNVAATPNGAGQANVAFNLNTSLNLVSVNVSTNVGVTQNITAGNLVIATGNSYANAHRDTYSNIGVLTANTNMNCATGVYQDVMLCGNINVFFQNCSATGYATTLTMYVRQSSNGSNTITWQNTIRWSDNNIPVLSTAANTADMFTFMTFDGGTIWVGIQVMGNVPLGNTWF